MEHTVPHHMLGVISALFGELTVLGFIALYVYFMLRTGALPLISDYIYGNEEQLVELFEQVHFILFFVMVTFLVQAYLLVAAVVGTERRWNEIEDQIGTDKAFSPRPCEKELHDARKEARASWLAALDLRHSYRVADATDALQYALLRQRFLSHRRLPTADNLPRDFNFSAYLRRLISHAVTEILHVTDLTWIVVVITIFVTLEMPVIVAEATDDEIDFNDVRWLVGFSWLLWVMVLVLDAKLSGIVLDLTPCHEFLTDTPATIETVRSKPLAEPLLAAGAKLPPTEKAGFGKSLEDARRFLEDKVTGRSSKAVAEEPEVPCALPPAFARAGTSIDVDSRTTTHERLFWGGKSGVGVMLLLLRTSLLLNALVIAVSYSWLFTQPEDWRMLVIALLPGLHTAFCTSLDIVGKFVLATSVENMRKPWAIKETLLEMKTEHTLRILRLLSTMQSQAHKIAAGSGALAQARPLSAREEKEMFEAFTLFDMDKNGSIDKMEMKNVMNTLGNDLDETELELLFQEMDTDGNHVISFKEFCRVMAREPNEEQTPKQVADAIFSMIDNDNSGKIETHELKVLLKSFGLAEEEVDNAASLFDVDHSGDISKKEFQEIIERMKSFAK